MYCIGPLIFFITAVENEFFISSKNSYLLKLPFSEIFGEIGKSDADEAHVRFVVFLFRAGSRLTVPDFHDSPRRFLACYDRIF